MKENDPVFKSHRTKLMMEGLTYLVFLASCLFGGLIVFVLLFAIGSAGF